MFEYLSYATTIGSLYDSAVMKFRSSSLDKLSSLKTKIFLDFSKRLCLNLSTCYTEGKVVIPRISLLIRGGSSPSTACLRHLRPLLEDVRRRAKRDPRTTSQVSCTLDLVAVIRLSAGDDITRNFAGELRRGDCYERSKKQATAAAVEKQEEDVAKVASKLPPAEMGHCFRSVYLPRLAVVPLANRLR